MSEKNKTIASATLIILGYDLDPDEVSQALDLVPSQAWRKGENHKRVRNDGTVEVCETVHQWGGWKLWLPEEFREMSLQSQVVYWQQILNERSDEIKKIKQQETKIIVDCFLATKSCFFKMPSELQTQLGELGVDLELSISNGNGPTARERRRMLRRRYRGR